MPKHVGIVACSAEGAALCYRTLCGEAHAQMGEHMHPEVSMHTYPLGDYMPYIASGDWDGVAYLMAATAEKLVSIGAELLICPDNTIHEAFELVADRFPVPWIHIADAVGAEAKERGFSRLGILGTKYLMEGPVYPGRLAGFGIVTQIPEEKELDRINTIIFKQLVNGIFTEESRLYFNDVIARFEEQGCDAVVLACTEIPLLVKPDACPLPALDSGRLLARAAIRKALGEE